MTLVETHGDPAPLSRWRAAIIRTLSRGVSSAVDLVYPPECLSCGAAILQRERSGDSADPPGAAHRQPLFCDSCWEELALDSGPSCPRCAAPMPPGAADMHDCPLCRNVRFPFLSASALGPYQGPLVQMVRIMKHQTSASLGLAFGRLMSEKVQAQVAGAAVDLVAPMPMHWLRRVRRGVNPPELLAEPIAAALRAPLARRALRFRRIIKRQSLLRPRERRLNVRHSLAATTAWDLKGAAVVLVDDVMTTGATASEAARALLAAGAGKVWVAVLARGIGA